MKKGTGENVDFSVLIPADPAGKVEEEQEFPRFDAGYKQELSKPEQFIHFVQKYVGTDWSIGLSPEQISICDKEYVLEDYQKRSVFFWRRRWQNGKERIFVFLLSYQFCFTMEITDGLLKRNFGSI